MNPFFIFSHILIKWFVMSKKKEEKISIFTCGFRILLHLFTFNGVLKYACLFLSYACKGQFMCSQGFPACACLKHVLNLTSAHLLCPLWIHQTAAIFLASQHLPRWDTIWDVLLGPNWIHRNRTLLRHTPCFIGFAPRSDASCRRPNQSSCRP